MLLITLNVSKCHFKCTYLAIFITAQVILLNLASAEVNNVPIFKVFRHKEEKMALIEPSIQIIHKINDGYNRIQWSASFPSYHTAVIKDMNYQVHALCQCSDTKVSNVRFFFTWFGQENAAEQKLQLEPMSPTPSSWPTYGTVTMSTDTSFTEVNGGTVVLRYDKQSIDMSGSIRCELETASGIILKSNRLDIFDVKEYVGKLSGISQVGSSTTAFPPMGLGSFEPVPDQMKDHLKKLLKYVQLDVQWSLATEDRSIGTSHTYQAQSPPTFFKQSAVPSNDIGQYYINKNLKLFVNMNTPSGIRLRDRIDNFGEFTKDVRTVLMLQDTTSTIAIKFHVKPEYRSKIDDIDFSQKFPIRVEPELAKETISTFTGNSDNRMACGFLVDRGTDLRIEWKKDNEVLSPKQMLDKYGVRTSDTIGSGVLHLNGVNVHANGVWTCSPKSLSGNLPDSLSASYHLMVTRFPGFGDFKSNDFVGTPPKLVYAMEGATINISCMVTAYDKDGNSAKPTFLVDNVPFQLLCKASNTNKINALCEIYNRISVVDMDVPQVGSSIKYMNKANYIIKNIPYKSEATRKKFNHVVSCSAAGSYLIADKVSVVTTQASTSVNIIPRLTKVSFENTPLNCSRSEIDDVGFCSAQKDNVFLCELSVAYVTLLKTSGVIFKKYWMIGGNRQSAIEELDDTAILKKYTQFSPDGNKLTVKSIPSETDMKTMSELAKIRCVVELYYPNYVGHSNISNLQISDDGNGMLDPAVESLKNQGSEFFDKAPMFYTSERDKQATFLDVLITFKMLPPPVTSVGFGIIVTIVLAILIIIIIIMLVAYLITRDRGETYIIDEKERAQGHNPEQELKDEQFKEYMRPEEGPIRGSRMSLASSIRVGSDDEGELDEYGEIDPALPPTTSMPSTTQITTALPTTTSMPSTLTTSMSSTTRSTKEHFPIRYDSSSFND